MVKPSVERAESQKTTPVDKWSQPKEAAREATQRWFARNRSLVLRQTPFWAQSLAGIVITLGLSSIAAGIFFRIDEVVTVTGQLEAISGKVEVKSPAGGKVSEVFFKDGDYVEKGDLLVKFDTRQALNDKATSLRLRDLERADLEDRLAILNAREDVLNKKVNTRNEITNELRKLVMNGGYQRVQYLQQLDNLYELETQLSNIKLDKNRTRLESEKSIGQLTNQLNEAELRLQYQNVLAPAAGVIFEGKARVDGVLGAGEPIMTIIPQEGLKAKVYIANKDIGFVKAGQKAQIRIDAFPFTQYGEIEERLAVLGMTHYHQTIK